MLQFSSFEKVHNSFMICKILLRYRIEDSHSYEICTLIVTKRFEILPIFLFSFFLSSFHPFREKSMPECNAAEIEKFERVRSSHVIEKPSRSGKAFSIVIFRVYDRQYISSLAKGFKISRDECK